MRVVLVPRARREYRRLDPAVKQRIYRRLNALGEDPSHGVRALRPGPGLRVRVGDWRIVFEVDDVVVVLRIAHRSEVYR